MGKGSAFVLFAVIELALLAVLLIVILLIIFLIAVLVIILILIAHGIYHPFDAAEISASFDFCIIHNT